MSKNRICDGDAQYERGYREGHERGFREGFANAIEQMRRTLTGNIAKKCTQAMNRQKLLKEMERGIAQAVDDIADGYWGLRDR